ncbi:MAG: hypothetical protein ACRDGH_17385 [Candidatus Limnocylindria bacterium]
MAASPTAVPPPTTPTPATRRPIHRNFIPRHDMTPGRGGPAAHDKHAGHDPEAFRRQFWIVLGLTIPVVIWSADVQQWLGYMAPAFPGSDLIPGVLGTIIFVYGGRVFLAGARRCGVGVRGRELSGHVTPIAHRIARRVRGSDDAASSPTPASSD